MSALRTAAITIIVFAGAVPSLAENLLPSFDGSSNLELLERPDVRQDLKLTNEQVAKVIAITNDVRSQKRASTPRGALADALAIGKKTLAARRKEIWMRLAEVLDEVQLKRFKGLRAQFYPALFVLPEVEMADELKLSEGQRLLLMNAQVEVSKKIGGLPRGASDAVLKRERRDGDSKALSILTDEQNTAFDAIKGVAFVFKESPDRSSE